jgi:hypothetical protein
MGIKAIPSEEILRQRLDQINTAISPIVEQSNIQLLRNTRIEPSPCFGSYVPVDVDVVPFDNSNTQKEGVSWMYKGFKGYAPILAYIGTEGYGIGAQLRTGSQHSQNGTPAFLSKILESAKKVTNQPRLVRMDSGFDSADNLSVLFVEETRSDFIIKRNLRQESPDEWYKLVLNDEYSDITHPREGKTVYTGSAYRFISDWEVRVVYEVTVRTTKANGQLFIDPDVEVSTFWASLDEEGEDGVTDGEVIRLYRDHATSEQFHSEIKTDMDLERFPSGNFNTNAVILLIGLFAYNILRIMGQESLRKDDAPRKRPVIRRRIRTVIQNLITIAVRVVRHARKVYLSLGRSNAWRFAFKRVHDALS